MRMTILGASGFLGAHVVRVALGEGLRVHALGNRHGPPGAGQGPGAKATWASHDLTQPGQVAKCLESQRPDAVLSLAALSRVADCEADPSRARRVNAELPGHIATWCDARDVRLVHVSTDLVFGGQTLSARGATESEPTAPVSTYGQSKVAGELAVVAGAPRASVVRLPLLYGDSAGRGLGASDSLRAGLVAGRALQLFTDEVRAPLWVGDAARGLVELARAEVRGVLHLPGPEALDRYAFGQRVAAALGLDAGSLVATTRAAAGFAERPGDLRLATERGAEWDFGTATALEDALVS